MADTHRATHELADLIDRLIEQVSLEDIEVIREAMREYRPHPLEFALSESEQCLSRLEALTQGSGKRNPSSSESDLVYTAHLIVLLKAVYAILEGIDSAFPTSNIAEQAAGLVRCLAKSHRVDFWPFPDEPLPEGLQRYKRKKRSSGTTHP